MKTTARLLLPALVVTFLSACGDRPAQDSIESAEKFLSKGELNSAAVELKRALSQNANSGQARYMLGKVLLAQGQFPAALTELTKALDLGYDKDEVRGKHALALIGNGRAKELLDQYNSVNIQDDRAFAEVRTSMGVAYLSLQQIAKAEQSFDEALRANPKYGWAMLNKARIALHKGDQDEAEKLVDGAIASGTGEGEAWYFKGAMLQLVKKDMAGAEKAFRQSAKDVRYKAAANNALASLFVQTNRIADLRTLHDELAKATPGLPGVVLIEAQIAFMEKNYGKAREAIDKLLRNRPTDQHLLVFSGGIDLARGAFLQAETHLGKAMQRSEGADLARRLLALTYLRMGQPEKSLATIKPILGAPAKITGNDLALAGEASLFLGQLTAAEGYYTEAVKQKPDDVGLKSAVALIDLAKGQTNAGFEALRRLAAADSGDFADKTLISAHLRRKEFDAALVALDRLEKKKGDPVTVAFMRGAAYKAKGQFSDARSSFESVLKLRPEHYAAVAQLAEIELKAGRADEAVARMKKFIASAPKNGPARLTLASLLEATGAKPAEVQGALSDAVVAISDDPGLRVALVTHMLKSRDPKSALTTAQQAVAAFPENVDVLDALGRALGDAGDFQQAVSIFGRVSTLSPTSATPHIRLADLHGRRGNMAEAGRSLRKAFELSPEAREIHVRMLAWAKINKDYSLPMNAAKELQRTRPASLLGYFLEGDAHAATGNWAGAIASFKGAVGKPDPNSLAPIRIFDASLVSRQPGAADRFAADWMKSHPDDGAFIEHVGLVTLNQGKLKEAERMFARATELNPKSPAALNNLAWTRAKLGIGTAVETAERAVALSPANPNVLDTLATAWASQQNYAKAIEVQRRAVSLARGGAPFRVNLARHLLAGGDKAAAKAELDAVVAQRAEFASNAEVMALRKSIEGKT